MRYCNTLVDGGASYPVHTVCRKTKRRAKPFCISIVPGGVYGGDGAIFASENPIFQSKNRFLAVSASENP